MTPATVKWKLRNLMPLGVAALAFASFDLPQMPVFAQQSQPRQIELKEGLHLYGETTQLNQLGKAYVVFQREQGKVVGAIYSPSSEFSCFTGSEKNNTLDVKEVGVGAQTGEAKIDLSKLHAIRTLGDTEQRLISECKQALVDF